jgi:hypothetical protein
MRASASAGHYRVFPSIGTAFPAFYFILGDEGVLSRSLFPAILATARCPQPAPVIAYIDDTYPFMLPQERERFVGALRAAALLET